MPKTELVNATAASAVATNRHVDDVDSLEIVLHESSIRDVQVQRCIACFTEWINSIVSAEKMMVQDFFDDVYDGKILSKLCELKGAPKFNMAMSALSFKRVLENVIKLTTYCTETLKIDPRGNWSATTIVQKHSNAILFFVRDLAWHYKMEEKLPRHVVVACVHMERKNKVIQRNVVKYNLTGETDLVEVDTTIQADEDEDAHEEDVFDRLYGENEAKVDQVRTLLLTFVNTHLAVLTGEDVSVKDFQKTFSDGCLLIQLICILSNTYISDTDYYPTPTSEEEKIENMRMVLSLLKQNDISAGRIYKKELVNGSELHIMRTVYRLFQKFRDV